MSASLDEQIAALTRRINTTKTDLKQAQDRWDDWKAGNLKVALARDVGLLRNLDAQRAASRPVDSVRPSGQVFHGARF
jgi:hypothetical protein